MSRAALFLFAFVVLGSLLVAPLAAADMTVGGDAHSYQLKGKDVERAGVAAVDTTDSSVNTKAPTCRVGTDASNDACDAGSIDANAPAAAVSVLDVHVGLGNIEQASSSGPGSRVLLDAAAIGALPFTSGVILATTAAASGLAVYLVWRLLKLAGAAGLVPLYSHLRDDELLNDTNRSRIFELIKGEPGISTKDIADRLDLAWGTVTHHLGKLEKSRLVVSKKYGKYRRYFVNGASEQKDTVAVLKIHRTADVAEIIRTHPGITQKEVGEALGVSSSTILWHVRRLEQTALIQKVRAGKAVKYFPSADLATFSHITSPNVAAVAAPPSVAPFGLAGPNFQP
ncbi:MAG: winged helix-turn-helix transcriptional regulator [Thermoplasmatota archaeon]